MVYEAAGNALRLTSLLVVALASIELEIIEPKDGAVVPIGRSVNVTAQVSGFQVGVDGNLFVVQNSIGLNRQFGLVSQTLQFELFGCFRTSDSIMDADNLLFKSTGDFVAQCAESSYSKFAKPESFFSIQDGRCEAAVDIARLVVLGNEQQQCGSGTFAVYRSYIQSTFTGALTYGGDPLPSVTISVIGLDKEALISRQAGFELGFYDDASYELVRANNLVRTHSGKDALMQALFATAAVGLVLEFGVFKGASLSLIAKFMRGRTCHGFDSFRYINSMVNTIQNTPYLLRSCHGSLSLSPSPSASLPSPSPPPTSLSSTHSGV
jgi:hypothetical protein